MTGASASPKPNPVAARTAEDDRSCSASGPQTAISRKPMAASSMPSAVRMPAGTRRMSAPPTSAPTGRATRNSSSTSAALIWDPSAMVIRAKIGMSTSAAIRAAPTKKLTSREPQAGRRANAPCGTSGAFARRLCSANRTAATAATPR